MFLSECVLIYLEPQHSDSLMRWISDTCSCAVFAAFEQILPDDPFGKMMLRNLQACDLSGGAAAVQT